MNDIGPNTPYQRPEIGVRRLVPEGLRGESQDRHGILRIPLGIRKYLVPLFPQHLRFGRKHPVLPARPSIKVMD
jgi:hypothetical protein